MDLRESNCDTNRKSLNQRRFDVLGAMPDFGICRVSARALASLDFHGRPRDPPPLTGDHGEIVGSILQRGGCRWRGSRRTQRWRPGGSDPSTGIVIGYIASVLMSVGILLILLKNGW
jgi:hypothetical protein